MIAYIKIYLLASFQIFLIIQSVVITKYSKISIHSVYFPDIINLLLDKKMQQSLRWDVGIQLQV